MRPLNSARTRTLLAVSLTLSGVIAVFAQVRDPQLADDPNAEPVRERRLVQRLEQARKLIAPDEADAKPDFAQGVRLLQSILDDRRSDDEEFGADDVFLGNEQVPRKSLKTEARRLIGELPPAGRQAYELLVGKIAQVEFEAARDKRIHRGVEAVSRRWFHTAAGYDATHALAMRDLDAGEPLAAAARLGELGEWTQARAPREPLLSLELAVAWRMAGQADRCRDVLTELKKSLGEKPVLRRGGNESLPLFENDGDALAWLDRWAGVALKPVRVESELQSDWPMVLGNAARNAFAGAAVPGQQPAWSRSLLDDESGPREDDEPSESDDGQTKPGLIGRSPTTLSGSWARVRVEIRTAVEQRMQAEYPILPAAQPIVVGDTLIVRTLSQLRAFRLSDGEPLWHSALLDTQLGELLGTRRKGRQTRASQPELEAWLQQRVWEDVGSGTLSSDGELVYSLQERNGGMFLQPQMAWRTMFAPKGFNKLVAIEAKTGRLRWELGGPRLSDVELPGAGAFFLGPPLPWRGQLFVLTDDGVDVRLVVLDPRDGQILWTQTLSASDPIGSVVAHDAGLSPTVAGDCVLCPSAAGSLIAVDPVRRELRWQATYRKPAIRTARTRFEFHPPSVNTEQWWPSGVLLVAGNRVLFAPPDHGDLLCLSAEDGRVLWRHARGEGLFVAGVSEPGVVLIVAKNDVRAVQLADGTLAWPQPAPIAAPCGRGLLIDGVLHLPVISNGGEVISLETRSGRQLTKTAVTKLPGNLIAANGQLVSQSATQVIAFPPLRDMQRYLARAFEQNPDNARTLEQRGRLNLHLGRRQRGMEDLRRSVALQPTAEAKQALAALLLEELRLDQADVENTIRELDTLVDDPKQRLAFARLRAHSLQLRGEHLAAARELLKLADAWEPDSELQSFGGNVTARQDRWIAARLGELRELMSPADRRSLDGELQTRLRTASEAIGHLPLRRFVALFSGSDLAVSAQRTMVDRLDVKKHRHEVEATLLSLRRSGVVEYQSFATARLAQQWLAVGQVELSRSLLEELSTRFADVRSLENKTGRELAAAWKTEFRAKLELAWPTEPLQSQPVSADEPIHRSYRIDWIGPPDPLREYWHLELDPSRLVVARDNLGRVLWKWKPPQDEYATPHVVGHYASTHGRWLVLVLGGQFFVADTFVTPGDDAAPRLLWQGVLFDRRAEQTVTAPPDQQLPPIAGMPMSFVSKDTSSRRFGRVAIVGDDVLCVQSGNRLAATRLATGELLWMHDGIPAGCELSGDDRAVIATTADRREVFVLSTLDGRLLARRDLQGTTLITSAGRHLVTWTTAENRHDLRVIDPLTNKDVIHERFALGAKPCVSLRDIVAVMDRSGRFAMWSLPDGRKLLDQTVPAIPNLRHLLVLKDRERWLLLTYTEEPPAPNKLRSRVSELYFDQWKVHGPCFAFSRSTGKPLWSAELDWQAVNAAQPADSPVLVLAAKVFRPNAAATPPNDGLKYKVDVLDKRSGRIVTLADDLLAQRFEFCEQRPNFDDKTIDVQIERSLSRLTFGK